MKWLILAFALLATSPALAVTPRRKSLRRIGRVIMVQLLVRRCA